MRNDKLKTLLANMGIVIASQAAFAKSDVRENVTNAHETHSEKKRTFEALPVCPNENMSKYTVGKKLTFSNRQNTCDIQDRSCGA